jgi:hypothetical protein
MMNGARRQICLNVLIWKCKAPLLGAQVNRKMWACILRAVKNCTEAGFVGTEVSALRSRTLISGRAGSFCFQGFDLSRQILKEPNT